MAPLRYIPSARALVDTASSTSIPTPSATSSSSDTFTPTPAPYTPNWIPVLILVLFGCGILGMMYWAYKLSAGKLPSTKHILKDLAAARNAHAKSKLKAPISRPAPAHTAAPPAGTEAAVSRFADTTPLTQERRAGPTLPLPARTHGARL
ncbi:hypothetical protein DFH09DRAFT_1301376 [Mycena vulgaris]|nr:hypothetical protein DFH09DRAFT_1301376 [Mycena vulgaris]